MEIAAILTAVTTTAGGTGAGVGVAGAIGAAASVAGTVTSYIGGKKAADASAKAEQLRKRQMNLEAQRAKRGEVRKAMVNRAQIASQADAQGAGQSSASAGVMGSVSTGSAQNRQSIGQSQEIGNKIFGANAQIAKGQGLQALGQGFQSLGQNFFNMGSNTIFDQT